MDRLVGGTVGDGTLRGFQDLDDAQPAATRAAWFGVVDDALDEMLAFLSQWLRKTNARDGNITRVVAVLKITTY